MKYSVVKYATYGLIVESAGKVIIEKSQVTNVSRNGISVAGECNLLVKDSIIEVENHGISAYGRISSGITVVNNYIVSSSGCGVHVTGQPPVSHVRNVTISGNTILSKKDGIHLAADAEAQFESSKIHSVKILDNTLRCGQSGIYLHVFSWWHGYIYRVTISGNVIFLSKSGDGVHLRTDSRWSKYLYDATIFNNKVSNATNGIHISAGEHTEGVQYDVTIVGNRVSDSEKGISVLGVHAEALVGINSNITANSICYNTLGISYDTHAHNSAYYNHIYRNSHGMTISNGATVNATYNYWGDETGPYHATFNPTGKGNSVNGNGTDLVFIPFLSEPISSLNELPVAVLQADKKTATTNQTVTLNASASSDDIRIEKYFFDFGDGTNSSWASISVVVHNYSSPGLYDARLTVRDDLGFDSNNTAIQTITVEMNVSLTLHPATMNSGDETLVNAHVTSGASAVQNVLVQLASNSSGSFTPSSGYTDSNGDFNATFAIYNVSVQTSIKITINASKNGYYAFDHENLTVLPPQGKWYEQAWFWISAVIIVAVAVVTLIWKKVRFRRLHEPQISE